MAQSHSVGFVLEIARVTEEAEGSVRMPFAVAGLDLNWSVVSVV